MIGRNVGTAVTAALTGVGGVMGTGAGNSGASFDSLFEEEEPQLPLPQYPPTPATTATRITTKIAIAIQSVLLVLGSCCDSGVGGGGSSFGISCTVLSSTGIARA